MTPGPSVLLSVSTPVQHGPRRAMLAALGSTTAIAAIMRLAGFWQNAVLNTVFLALFALPLWATHTMRG